MATVETPAFRPGFQPSHRFFRAGFQTEVGFTMKKPDKKTRPHGRVFFFQTGKISGKSGGALNVRGLLAFRPLRDIERNLLAFFQRLEAIHRDGGEMREEIFAAIIGSNKAETFGIVEPLDSTSCHNAASCKKK
jgi:hypothetical protein